MGFKRILSVLFVVFTLAAPSLLLGGVETDKASQIPALPAGLVMIQLNGNLVCPPLLVPGTGIFVACDDRTVSLLQLSGESSWRREFDRSIHGPLSGLIAGMVLVNLSGGNLACLGSDGSILWQRRLEENGEGTLIGTPDGRIIQVGKSGTIYFLNPNATPLFRVQAAQSLAAIPKARADGLELPLANGQTQVIDWSGRLTEPVQRTPIVLSDPNGNLRFQTEQATNGGYRVRLKSNQALLDFSSPGTIGHWLVENSSDLTVVWGDSLWRCFIFHPGSGKGVPGSPRNLIDFQAPASNDFTQGALSLEAHYLDILIDDDPLSGSAKAIDHIQEVMQSGKLAGRMRLYENTLLDIIQKQKGRRFVAGTEQRVRAINFLARFPSLRQAHILTNLIRSETDAAVIAAWIDYSTQLGIDPFGEIRAFLQDKWSIWQSQNLLQSLRSPLDKLGQRMGWAWLRTGSLGKG